MGGGSLTSAPFFARKLPRKALSPHTPLANHPQHQKIGPKGPFFSFFACNQSHIGVSCA